MFRLVIVDFSHCEERSDWNCSQVRSGNEGQPDMLRRIIVTPLDRQ